MAVRIRVRNFQSLESVDVEISGFTVINGPNNSGKTALMRAVRGVFENSGGDAFVRHGADSLAVNLNFGDSEITWSKGPKVKPTYVVGGKTIHPGRAVPDEVRGLGISPITAGSGEVWPQIASQFSGQLFLLDMPGSAIAEAISDVDRVSRLTEALRYADSDKRSANAELKLRRKDREDAHAEVQRFEGLDAAGDVYANAVQAMVAAEHAEGALTAARAVAGRLRASSARVTALAGVSAVRVPAVEEVRGLAVDVAVIQRLALSVRRWRTAVNAIPKGVRVPDATELVTVASEISKVAQLRTRLKSAQHTVRALPSGVVPPSTSTIVALAADLANAKGLAKRLHHARAVVQRYQGATVSLSDAAMVTKVGVAITALRGMQARVSAAKEMIELINAQLSKAVLDRDAVQLEVDALIREIGVCPTCGSQSANGGVHPHGDGLA